LKQVLDAKQAKPVTRQKVAPAYTREALESVLLIYVNGLSYVRSVRIDSRTELVIATDIAKRLRISSQRVNVLAGGPGFPKPLGKLGSCNPVKPTRGFEPRTPSLRVKCSTS
jgi:hypothetical protein